jgi:hypothetical protein
MCMNVGLVSVYRIGIIYCDIYAYEYVCMGYTCIYVAAYVYTYIYMTRSDNEFGAF